MKLLFVLLILAGGYCAGLCKMANLAIGQVTAINQTYTNVSVASDEWSRGNTSGSPSSN